LPIPPSLHVEALLLVDDGLTILASSEATDAPCPLCGWRSGRVHSRYRRTLADLPWADVAVSIRVRVCKFFCDNDACRRRIFAERLSGVAQSSARRTDRQGKALTAIALALGGEGGARLAGDLGMPVSPDTLLRLIRDAPDQELPTPAVLGVDDWAIHRGYPTGRSSSTSNATARLTSSPTAPAPALPLGSGRIPVSPRLPETVPGRTRRAHETGPPMRSRSPTAGTSSTTSPTRWRTSSVTREPASPPQPPH
jgi:hypothetical protein